MRLGLRVLSSSSTLNNLTFLPEVRIFPGDTVSFMVQIVDLDLKQQNKEALRYIPASGSTLSIAIQSINAANNLSLNGSQPFADDKSIWQFDITSTQSRKIGTTGITAVLTEGGSTKSANISQFIIVDPGNMYGC